MICLFVFFSGVLLWIWGINPSLRFLELGVDHGVIRFWVMGGCRKI